MMSMDTIIEALALLDMASSDILAVKSNDALAKIYVAQKILREIYSDIESELCKECDQ